jgi:hypothetical protein
MAARPAEDAKMSLRHALLLSAIILLISSHGVWSEQNTQRVSLCSIQRNPESFLHAHVEVHPSILVGAAHFGQLLEGKCSFRVAFGNDYQTFGHRFRVKDDDQWALMWKLLRTPPPHNCVNKRIVRANIKGIVERVPATGSIPEDEMGLEIVILSVSEIVHVPTNCTASDAHSSDTH